MADGGKRRLIMPEWEIAEYYRDASDKKRQIQILADLNLTTENVIREVLQGLGYEVPEQKVKKATTKSLRIGIEDDIEGDIKSQIMTSPRKKKEDPDAERKKMVKMIKTNAESIADCLIAMGLVVNTAQNGM